MQEFYRLLKKMDISMLITVAAIIALGLVVLDSAASIKTNNYVERQLLFVAVGVSSIFIFLKFDYSVLKNYSSKLYIVALVLLVCFCSALTWGRSKPYISIMDIAPSTADFS